MTVPYPPSDHEVTLQAIAEIADRAARAQSGEPVDDDLPPELVTDSLFGQWLDEATRLQAGRLRDKRQVDFNDAVVNALHQLDHRTRTQRQLIGELLAELTEARRAIAALEARDADRT